MRISSASIAVVKPCVIRIAVRSLHKLPQTRTLGLSNTLAELTNSRLQLHFFDHTRIRAAELRRDRLSFRCGSALIKVLDLAALALHRRSRKDSHSAPADPNPVILHRPRRAHKWCNRHIDEHERRQQRKLLIRDEPV